MAISHCCLAHGFLYHALYFYHRHYFQQEICPLAFTLQNYNTDLLHNADL